jgi:hypothetical protein
LGNADPPAEPPRHPVHFIGRFEQFRPDFSRVCAHLKIEDYAGDLPATRHATDASDKVIKPYRRGMRAA